MPKAAILKSSLDLLYYSGASALFGRLCSGTGAIFMLHHVFPGGGLKEGFAPNAGIELTPEFLDAVIRMVRKRGFDLVSLEEAVRRIEAGTGNASRFATFTLDDGYRDNLLYAKPVFDAHDCPYAIFVAPSINDGTCQLWWRGLEHAIASTDRVEAYIGGQRFDLAARTPAEKQEAWLRLYWPVRNLEQHSQRDWIATFCERHGVDLGRICTDAAMTWTELRQIAAEPLCTIGAHTINHYAVSQLPPEEALNEMVKSADRIESELGQRPEYFAYPYGDEHSAGPRDFDLARQAGFRAAVTTRKGMIYPGHRHHLTGLPRVSLSGSFQELRYVKTLLTGVPFTIFNGLRRMKVN